jgi:bifunctional non-homologous end joining protein LigD
MGARYSHDDTRTFSRLLAMLCADTVPDIATVARPIQSRGGRVYVDFGQNGHGLTIVAPYSVRPLPGAPASCPLRWSEVTPSLDPARFTIVTLPKRFEKMDDPLAPVLQPRSTRRRYRPPRASRRSRRRSNVSGCHERDEGSSRKAAPEARREAAPVR